MGSPPGEGSARGPPLLPAVLNSFIFPRGLTLASQPPSAQRGDAAKLGFMEKKEEEAGWEQGGTVGTSSWRLP